MKVGVRVKSEGKMNRKGMTLVEVIVAMAILAIVITPTLRIFASASGTNLESRKRQRATSVSEGVMESMKAYTMESLCNQFKTNSFKGIGQSTDAARPTTADAWAIRGGVEEYPFLADGTLKKDADSYKLQAKNVTSEGQYYDVEILATPSPGYVVDVLHMEDVSAYSDSIVSLPENTAYTARTTLEQKAKDKLTSELAPSSIDAVTVSDFKREINVKVTDNGTVQKVELEVKYSCKAKVDYKNSTGAAASKTYDQALLNCKEVLDADTGDTKVAVYDNTDTIAGETVNNRQAKLNHLHLYYFPVYTSEFGDNAKDVITIDTSLTGLYATLPGTSEKESEARGYDPLHITLAKQAATTLTDSQLNSGEVNYEVSLGGTKSGSGDVELRTNLRENLSPMNSVITPPSIAGGYGSDRPINEGVLDKIVLLYDVEIHVYEAGTTKEVATFIGTMNE